MFAISSNSAVTLNPALILNLFQGPFTLFRSALVAQWMLKQVQHDGVVL
jgi:hypothetical protein